MKLPNAVHAIVEQRKIEDYILAIDHPEGAGKAAFFAHFGFAPGNWRILADALISHATTNLVSHTSQSVYGTKFRIDGPMSCPNGRSPTIRAIWVIDAGADTPRLVTAYPL